MLEYDLAVDEYLHAIVRTRPWTVAEETELLEALGEWLYRQPDLDVDLDAVTPLVTQRYARDTALGGDELARLDTALARLKAWTDMIGLREVRQAIESAAR